jgi:hypothetical protein
MYHIDAIAYDNSGFATHVQKTLTVARLFGFGSVTVNSRTINTDSDCPQENCGNGFTVPCNTASFNATLNLVNNTNFASGNLRVRILTVPDAAYQDSDDPPALPPEAELPPPPQVQPNPSPPQASVSTVTPLAAHSNELVQVVGVAPKPIQQDCFSTSGIGFQIFAELDELVGSQWIPIDSIKVTEGQWPVIGGFAGPGGGINNPRHGQPPGNEPLVYESLNLSGPNPDTVAAGAQKSYTATAIAANTTTTQSVDVTSQAQWSANCPGGVFHAPNTAGQNTISATYAIGSTQKMVSKTINVTGGATPTPTPTPTATPTPTPTATPIPTPTPTPTPPVVTLFAAPTKITKSGTANFVVTASSASHAQPIMVNYSMSGNAILGSDYTLSANPITIPPNQSSGSATLTAITAKTKGSEKATMTLTSGTGYTFPTSGKKKKPKIQKATVTITNK